MGINNENVTMINQRSTSNICLRRGLFRFIKSFIFIHLLLLHSSITSFILIKSFIHRSVAPPAFMNIHFHRLPFSTFFILQRSRGTSTNFVLFPRGLERGVTGAPSHLDRASSCGRADGRRNFKETSPPNL